MNTYIKLFTNDLKNKGLSLFDKAVYGSLTTKYQYHNNQPFYTYEAYIADELEISESTVKRSIKTLSEQGLITISKKYHKQLKKSVNYYSIPDALNDSMEDTTTPVEITPEKPNNTVINQPVQPRIETGNDDSYDELNEAIIDEFNQTAIEYFGQFKDMFELGSARIEHLADITNLKPTDIITIFKSVKQAA